MNKKHLITLFFGVALLIAVVLIFPFVFKGKLLAQFPSFEIYKLGGTSYPTVDVDNVHVELTDKYVIITAPITDVSGVYSAIVTIEGLGKSERLLDDGNNEDGSEGDDIYGAIFSLEDLTLTPNQTYYLDILVEDNLLNLSVDSEGETVYKKVGSFTTGFFGSFEVNPSEIMVGGTITLTASLSGVDGQSIIFTDETDSIAIGSSVISSGVATATYTYSTATLGSHTLKASYAGDATHIAFDAEDTINIYEGKCSSANSATICIKLVNMDDVFPSGLANFTISPTPTTAGQKVTLSVSSSLPAGEEVIFQDDTAGFAFPSVATNSSGVAKIEYFPAFSGTHTLRATYKGSPALGYGPASKSENLVLTGNCNTRNSATICINTPETGALTVSSFEAPSVTAGASTTLTATMSLPFPNLSVTFTDTTTGVTIGTSTTNASGVATINYDIPLSTTAGTNNHTLTAVCATGNSSKTATLAVTGISVNSLATSTTETISPGTPTTLTATILPISAGFPVTFTDTTTGVTIGTATTNSSGVATIDYIPLGVKASRTLVATHTPNSSSKTTVLAVTGASISGWGYKKLITVDSYNTSYTLSSNLTNFPLLVKFTNDSNIGTNALSTGYDIRFTDSAGNLLDYEREYWSGGGGTAASGIFWVKVPTLSYAADTAIYIYYGKSNAVDLQSPTVVWDSNFKGVWHLNSASSITDSTANQFNGINNAATLTNFSPYTIGSGLFFNTGTPYISFDTSNSLAGTFTISVWSYPNNTNDHSLFGSRAPSDYGFSARMYNGSYIYGDIGNGSSWITNSANASYSYGASYHYITYVVTPSGYTVYANGAQKASGTFSGNPLLYNSTHKLYLGWNGSGSYFLGGLDEFRVSSIARSADWIKFEFYNMNSTATIKNALTFGAQTSL